MYVVPPALPPAATVKAPTTQVIRHVEVLESQLNYVPQIPEWLIFDNLIFFAAR